MDTQTRLLTIREAAHETGLTVHTLRYYERIGLLAPVGRASNGHRRYSARDLELIRTLNRWRLTGMPLADLQRYVALLLEGDSTAAERRNLLEAHRETVVKQLCELQDTLAHIDYKITHYFELEEAIKEALP